MKTQQSRATIPALKTFAIVVKIQRTQMSLLLLTGNNIEQWYGQKIISPRPKGQK